MPSRRLKILILILIIATTIFFRFWQFSSIPPGLYQDEAMNGADALNSLESGKFSVFYANNNGREGMIVWLDALVIKIFRNEPWVLRLFPALAGVLAVLGLYFLTEKLFSIEVALASSFFMAVSFWAVNFSRIGFRAGLMLPFLIWSFYFLLCAINRSPETESDSGVGLRSRTPTLDFLRFTIAGILFSLGFYTYISYRFAPILLLFFLPHFIKFKSKKLWVGVAFFIAAALIVALPIGIYFLNNPQDFFGRSSQVSIFTGGNIFKSASLSVVKTLGMFNIFGDLNWRHNLSGFPQLSLPIGVLFILGIILSLKRFKWQDKFLFSWLFIFLLPNFLTTEGNPHSLRALGAMPMAMIFSSIGLMWIYGKFKKFINNKIKNPDLATFHNQLKRIKKLIFLLLIVFIVFIAVLEFDRYFFIWPNNQNTVGAFSKNQVEIANYLNNLPPNTEKYVIWPSDDRPTSNGLPVSSQTIYFLTYGKSDIKYLKNNELDKIKSGSNGMVVTPLYFDLELLHNLNKQFKNSKIEFIYLNTPILVVP